MQALLTAIVTWISINYALPATTELPTVRFTSPIEIAFLHYQATTPEAQKQIVDAYAAQPAGEQRQVVSAFDTKNDIIFLHEGWTAGTPADLSTLVHEMVHHLQTAAGMRFACPEDRELLAYAAQEKWLELFATNLEREFAIDDMTLLVTTHCSW